MIRHFFQRPEISTILFALTVAIVSLTAMADESGWPTYRHDAARSGVTDESTTPPLSLDWVFKPLDGPRPAWHMPAEESPKLYSDKAFHVSVARGLVFFGSSQDDSAYALAMDTGEIQWRFQTEGPVRFCPMWYKDRVYFGSDDGRAYCLEATTGKFIWKLRAGPTSAKFIGNGRIISKWPVRTSVLVKDDTAYFAAGIFPYEGLYIYAVNSDDGSLVWKNDTIGDRSHDLAYGGMSPFGYLLASEDNLYVPSGRALPATFDRRMGEMIFFSKKGKDGGDWTLLDGDRLIAGVDRAGEPMQIEFDARSGQNSGEMNWKFHGVDMVTTPDTILNVTQEGVYSMARDPASLLGREKETLTEKQILQGRLLFLEDKYAEGSRDPKLETEMSEVREQIGRLTEEEKSLKQSLCNWFFPSRNIRKLILANDVIYVGGKGRIAALNVATGEELWSQDVQGTVFGLVASAGNLIVSTDNGWIYCFKEGDQGAGKEIVPIKVANPYEYEPGEDVADWILKKSDEKNGWCLVLGSGSGRLAYEIAMQTNLNIVALEKNPMELDSIREKLKFSALSGTRIAVEPWEIEDLPDYFANLVVSEELIEQGNFDYDLNEIFRVLKPSGGSICLNLPVDEGGSQLREQLTAWHETVRNKGLEFTRNDASGVVFTRGPLPGAGGWTHLYADTGNTACSDDELANGPFEVLWYGEPGPVGMVERHGRAAAPVALDGRLFIQGEENIRAYDAYNGTFLWQRDISGAVRPRVDVDSSNLAVGSDGLYVGTHAKCLRLDPATGKTLSTYSVPGTSDLLSRRWGYIAYKDGVLYGTSAQIFDYEYGVGWKKMFGVEEENGSIESAARYSDEPSAFAEDSVVSQRKMHNTGTLWRGMAKYPTRHSQRTPKNAVTENIMSGDTLFALDVETEEVLWSRAGARIPNIAVTISDQHVFLVHEVESEEQRQEALEARKRLTEEGVYEDLGYAALPEKERDVRLAVCLDRLTGRILWKRPVDFTECGGDKMGAAYADGMLLFFGHFSNHDIPLFFNNELRWRRITALSAETGDVAWSRSLNYLRRPLIVGDRVIIEPRACDLYTGEIETRVHPITGETVPWEFLRPGHSCSVTSASKSALFYRSAWTAIYDLDKDAGLTLFGGVRMGCWLNAIPGNGLVMIPEASSGCVCTYPVRTTVVLKPKREETDPWSVFITHGRATPVKRLALNLGAGGDMRDEEGNLWLAHPRLPTTSADNHGTYGIEFDIEDEYHEEMEYFRRDHRELELEDSSKPWLFSSGCIGPMGYRIPLLDRIWDSGSGSYTVRLGFLASPEDEAGQRVFDVKLQGSVVEENLDIAQAASGSRKPVVREYMGITVENDLLIKFVPKSERMTDETTPLLNFIEILLENEKLSDVTPQETSPITLFHENFDRAESKQDKIAALEGMASIASPSSLSRIEQYCRLMDPILREYRDADPDLVAAAVKLYFAIANKSKDLNRKRYELMLEPSAEMLHDPAMFDAVIEQSKNFPPENREKIVAEAAQIIGSKMARTKGIKKRQAFVAQLSDLGIDLGEASRASGYITRWNVLGAFSLTGKGGKRSSFISNKDVSIKKLIDTPYIDEPDVDLDATCKVGGTVLEWREYSANSHILDLRRVYGLHRNNIWNTAYACADIFLPDDMNLQLRLGSSDGFKCWFNGRETGVFSRKRGFLVDEDIMQVTGRKGRNTVLVKFCRGTGKWETALRVLDSKGQPIEGFQN
ncbi:PQQ-binding-like beta-propeller repeat protein [Candidatus Hydrogenedentota bacterium]